jgi:hypothetical protein
MKCKSSGGWMNWGLNIENVADEIAEGITSGDNDVFFVEIVSENADLATIQSPADGKEYTIESDLLRPLTDGDGINRFQPPEVDSGVIYPYTLHEGNGRLIPESRLEEKYPQTYKYLSNFRDRLANRGTDRTNQEYKTWYSLYRSRDMEVFEQPKLLTPDICGQSEFSMDDSDGLYFRNSAFGFVPTDNRIEVRDFYLSVLNSTLTWFYIYQTSTVLENDFRRFTKSYLSPLPIPEAAPESDPRENKEQYDKIISDYLKGGMIPNPNEPTTFLSYLGREMYSTNSKRQALNLHLPDYLGTYDDGPTLADLSPIPPEGRADSLITETEDTAEGLQKLRIDDVTVERDGDTLTLSIVPYVKPDDPDEYEKEPNSRDYITLDPVPAMRFTDLDDDMADLIESFVPYAVDEAGGTAGFRDNATGTISPLDRLEALTLPALADVRDGLETYREQVARAAELDEQIERTDELIDEIVYELYGLTDEEIAIVEEAVGD